MGRKNEDIGNRVTLCQDGKYRWVYEVNMLTNYSILFDVWKVFGITIVILVIVRHHHSYPCHSVLHHLPFHRRTHHRHHHRNGQGNSLCGRCAVSTQRHRLSVLCCNIRMEICSAFHYGRERSDTSADAAFGKERSNHRSVDCTCRFGIRTTRSGGRWNPFAVTQFDDLDTC